MLTAARRFASLLTLLVIAWSSTRAQIEMAPSENGFGLALQFGVAHPHSGTVSDRTLGARTTWDADLGATAYFAHHGFFVGPEIAWVPPLGNLNQGGSKLSAGDVMLETGRIYRISDRTAVYPLLGLGWGWNDLHNDNPPGVTQRGAPGSFDAAISQPATRETFHRNTTVATIGAGVQSHFFLRDDGYGGERGLFVGLRSGVRLSHDVGHWTADGQSLRGGPTTALAGPFIQLSLGYAAWSRPPNLGPPCPNC
jgi:hypothetical protein